MERNTVLRWSCTRHVALHFCTLYFHVVTPWRPLLDRCYNTISYAQVHGNRMQYYAEKHYRNTRRWVTSLYHSACDFVQMHRRLLAQGDVVEGITHQPQAGCHCCILCTMCWAVRRLPVPCTDRLRHWKCHTGCDSVFYDHQDFWPHLWHFSPKSENWVLVVIFQA